jgi:opacity protein-like surface antigen
MWVVGLEADFQGADEKEHSTLTQNFSAPFLFANGAPAPAGVFGTTALDYAAKIEWFGTARLRAGYLFGDGAVLTYVTGGLAYGKVDVAGTSALTAAGFNTAQGGFNLPQPFLLRRPSIIPTSTPVGWWAPARRASC